MNQDQEQGPHLLSNAFAKSRRTPTVQRDYWDSELPRFFLRVFPSGGRTWNVRFTVGGIRGVKKGQRRLKSIGDCDTMTCSAARIEARKILGLADNGIDPTAKPEVPEVQPDAPTFGDLVEKFKNYAKEFKRTSSLINDMRMIEHDLKPWMGRRASDISKRDVIALRDDICARGSRIASNRTVVLISSIFNNALEDELVESNPAHKVKKLGMERPRTRALDDAEIQKLWKALDAQPLKIAAFFKLGLLTGQRAREILQIPVKEIEFAKAQWTIPAERNKGKRDHIVPLGPTAIKLIEDLIKSNKPDHPYLFPSHTTSPAPINEYKSWMDAVRDASGLNAPEGDPARFVYHDLRRTLTTIMTREGFATQFLTDRITNHAKEGVGGKHYNMHDYLKEKRKALVALDKWLAELCPPPVRERHLHAVAGRAA